MTWFRRGHTPPTAAELAATADRIDSPEALRYAVFTLIRFINQNSGRLPGEAVVLARRLTDTLRDVLDTSEVRALDVYTVIAVRATLDDYLPTTLRTYLSLDEDVVDRPVGSGPTPAQSLIDQLAVLQESMDATLVAARNQDADALLTQGSFLQTKFSRSDLDL